MTDALMWQVHPPLVQPSSSQVWDIGIFCGKTPCPMQRGRDWTLLWPGVVHNLCTWVHLRNRGSRQSRDETTKRCRFNAFSGRKKTFRKSVEILQEVGHEKTKLQMNGKSLPLSFSWRRSHSVPIITGTSSVSMFSNQGTISNMEGVSVFHILTSLKWGDEIQASSTVQVLLALDCDSLSGAPSATLTGLES